MPVIYLVRHGQAAQGTRVPEALSLVGREQAAMVGVEIARRAPRDPLVVSGTLGRQRETATLLMSAAALAGEPSVDSRWDEYDHLELMRRYTDPPSGNHADPRGTQTLLDQALGKWIRDTDSGGWDTFIGGAKAAIDELAAVLSEETDAIVVTSGGVLAAICGTFLSMPPAGIVALNRVMVNGAITTLVVGGSGTSLLAFNDHAHLSGKGRPLVTYR